MRTLTNWQRRERRPCSQTGGEAVGGFPERTALLEFGGPGSKLRPPVSARVGAGCPEDPRTRPEPPGETLFRLSSVGRAADC